MPILHQIWLGLYWILHCEMNIFWAYGILPWELQRILSPRAKGCGPYSKSHMPGKCSFHSAKSNGGQAKFGAKWTPKITVNVTLDLQRLGPHLRGGRLLEVGAHAVPAPERPLGPSPC